MRMPSGAGHDAQMLARVCPTAMVFTPSVDGLSHNIAEFTEDADIEAGANVLLQVVLELLTGAGVTTATRAAEPASTSSRSTRRRRTQLAGC
jgi:hypothetical protein